MDFGYVLKTLRISADIGLRELARATDISPTYLSLIENSKTPLPSPARIAQLEKALEVPPGYLLSVTQGLKSDMTLFAREVPEVVDFLNVAKRNSMASTDFMKLTGFLNAYGWQKLEQALETCALQCAESEAGGACGTVGGPYLWPFLTEKLIFDLYGIKKKASFFEQVVNRMAEQCKDLNWEGTLGELLDRESLSSTGIGNGVAIPHACGAGLDRMIVAFSRIPEGLDFDSIDGEPVYIALLLVGPRSAQNLHLKLLARMARLVSNRSFSKSVLEASEPGQIISIFRSAERSIP